MRRSSAKPREALDPEIIRLIEALARAAARRDIREEEKTTPGAAASKGAPA